MRAIVVTRGRDDHRVGAAREGDVLLGQRGVASNMSVWTAT
jgi:hypothetical protein